MSRTMTRPFRVAAATISLLACRRIVGPVTNSAAGCVNQSFTCSVFGSSATIAFAFPSPVVRPAPIAATSVPSDANAIAPTTGPPLVFQDMTRFASLSRSTPQTAFGARPQPADVAAYNVVSIAIDDVHFEFAGRNSAGRCISFPEGRPSTCSMPSLEITYPTPEGRNRNLAGPPRPSSPRGDPGIRSGGGSLRLGGGGGGAAAPRALPRAGAPEGSPPDRPRASIGTPFPGSPITLR